MARPKPLPFHFFSEELSQEEHCMRKVIVSEFITLDGVVEAPNQWSFPYWNDEIAQFKRGELFAVDALLLGRTTYEGFAAAWPGRTDEAGYADRINGMPKHVVSTTLQQAEWNNSHVIGGNVAQEVARLKQEPGQDILVFGSGTLAEALLRDGLVDQYNLLVYPIVLGSGQRLFGAGGNTALKLVDSKTYGSGVVLLIYQPDTPLVA
jgi:dihydrofolate reductase